MSTGRATRASRTTRSPRRSPEALDAAVRQLVSKALTASDEVIDVFTAAGLKKPDISVLSDQFLAEVRQLKHKNVASELLAKLLKDEIRTCSARNLVQGRAFSEMLKKTLNAYHNRAIATHEVIEELIKLAKGVQAAKHGAAEVHCVDASQQALDWVERNAELNGVADKVQCWEGDAFAALRQLKDNNERFDVVIMDPPALIPRRKDIKAGEEIVYDYGEEFYKEYIAPKGCKCSATKHLYSK